MPGPFASRSDELRALRRRVPKYRVPFPDLKCEQRTAPCSNVIAVENQSATCRLRAGIAGAKQFAIGHNHKQGLELITPGMMPHLKHLGGAKT